MQRPQHVPSPVFFLPLEGFTLYYVSKTNKIVSCQTAPIADKSGAGERRGLHDDDRNDG